MSVEVERKFLCSEDTVRTLEEIGGMSVCVGQRQIQDRYFDTPRFDLTLRDMWLRNRGGCWELKCPTVATLCLTADQKVEGKMHVYLQRNHPEHYARLLSEHIL
uniref:Thiamine triphosphatase n=1 Tax=Lates calcarifer TaxID=8187 RepID=A0A4W6C377_LATCA